LLDKMQSEEHAQACLQAMQETWGFPSFRTSAQRDAMVSVLEGKDSLIILPTGAGKSLCFQVPAMVQAVGKVTLVISPLIALAKDQVEQLEAVGVDVATFNSTIDSSAQERIEADLRSDEPSMRLLYVTPEALTKVSAHRIVTLCVMPPCVTTLCVRNQRRGRTSVLRSMIFIAAICLPRSPLTRPTASQTGVMTSAQAIFSSRPFAR
jgi:superfamily II DNA helicase RecQ